LVRLALKYPPATRALLEQLQQGKATGVLYKSLNPIPPEASFHLLVK
jgi:hypothetical protein